MNFFKRLFSSKKEEDYVAADDAATDNEGVNFEGMHTAESFENRYIADNMDPQMLDDCLKMVDSYFADNKIEKKIAQPINHPANLDQTDQEGFGFVLYCKAFQLEEEQATLILAYAFSDFLVQKHGFKLYKDTKPEYPLRAMTLKYDRDSILLSLYPFEYASKVLNGNETFSELAEKINRQVGQMPDIAEVVEKYTKPENRE